MRILHFADLHIGVESYSRTDPATGLPTRLHDTLRAFDELVDAAIAEDVDLVLFCGDAYKSRDPSQTHQREFAKRIARLVQARVPVFLLTGNHDLPNAFGRATALEIFPTLEVPGVTVASRPATYRVETKGGPVQVVALPWLRRSAVQTQEEARGLSFEQTNDYMQASLAEMVRREAATLDPALPSLLAAHVTISSAKLSSERSMMLGTDYILLPSQLALPEFDYVALGHVHLHQRLWDAPPLVYAGSLHRVDFSEEGQPKGFCLVELAPSKPRGERLADVTFREVWSRPFVTIDVNVPPGDPDPTTTVLRAIGRKQVRDAIVRVLVRLPEGLRGRFQESEVRKALAEAHYVAALAVEVERDARTRLGRGLRVEGLGPLEALDLYFDARQTSPQRREVLLRYARQLLSPGEADAALGELTMRVAASLDERKGAFALRQKVFVEEQGISPKEEWDGRDEEAVLVVAFLEGRVVGTGRLLMEGGQARIGRMAVEAELRRRGIGAKVLALLEEEARQRGLRRAVLHAQTYVKDFYAARGYKEEGETFLEAGIEHVAMTKDLQRG
ncbi:MAG: exonuclease subunit SbcD [Chloroflexi bacterium]|nr:exonuclease subunit SbcD [Chloroflexota bacterium]